MTDRVVIEYTIDNRERIITAMRLVMWYLEMEDCIFLFFFLSFGSTTAILILRGSLRVDNKRLQATQKCFTPRYPILFKASRNSLTCKFILTVLYTNIGCAGMWCGGGWDAGCFGASAWNWLYLFNHQSSVGTDEAQTVSG